MDIIVNGEARTVADETSTLLDVLRGECGITSVKDGCSPQGQCGCCTVLVDGQARVSCVTPVRRVRGRAITTVEGLDHRTRTAWGEAFTSTGGSQCGFCTPGIVCRFESLRAKGGQHNDRSTAEDALLAHLCRCTGWQPIVDAWVAFPTAPSVSVTDAAIRRAEIEGGAAQGVGSHIALGEGGFADDTAPAEALVAVPHPNLAGEWIVAASRTDAVRAAGKVQGRRTTATFGPPIDLPEGDWAITLQTSWVEPGYLETDASWCAPGGTPVSALANGGAFGGKANTEVVAASRRLADEHDRPVRVLYAREDVVRLGAKRPPLAAGLKLDGTGVIRVARTAGIVDAIVRVLPEVTVEEVDIPGPATDAVVRGAGWLEASVLAAAIRGEVGWIESPGGGSATAAIADDGSVDVRVRAGAVADDVEATVLRSYCTGAAHMGLGLVRSEHLAVDPDDGSIHDLTIRSFGILRAVDTPTIDVTLEPSDGEPVNASDAAMAAVAAAAWLQAALPSSWPMQTT